MKCCTKCGKTKPESEFSKNKASKDGLRPDCKECGKSRSKSYYSENAERIKSSVKQYQQDNKESISERRRKHYEANSEVILATKDRTKLTEYGNTHRQNHPIKVRAVKAVHKALKAGRLIKSPCAVCGNPNTVAHHDDYSEVYNVRWLCRKHHAEWHRLNGEGKNG